MLKELGETNLEVESRVAGEGENRADIGGQNQNFREEQGGTNSKVQNAGKNAPSTSKSPKEKSLEKQFLANKKRTKNVGRKKKSKKEALVEENEESGDGDKFIDSDYEFSDEEDIVQFVNEKKLNERKLSKIVNQERVQMQPHLK